MQIHMLSPEEKANIIRMKMVEALSEHAPSPVSLSVEREQTFSPEFSTNGYSAALHGAPQHHIEAGTEQEDTSEQQPSKKSINRKALRQAQVSLPLAFFRLLVSHITTLKGANGHQT